jgi:DNA-binding NtrC family response regulator
VESEIPPPHRQILIIDDDQFVRDFAVNTIEFCTNSKVLTFESGFRAWHHLHSNPTSATIVIADANIPDMNGLELLDQLKKLRPDVTFIITSSNPDHEQTAYHMGANAFVSKPFDVNDLLTVIQELILTPLPPSNLTERPA